MPLRSDLDAARARLEALEREKIAADKRAEELAGRAEKTEMVVAKRSNEIVRYLKPRPDITTDEIIEAIESETGLTTVSKTRRGLVWRGIYVELSVFEISQRLVLHARSSNSLRTLFWLLGAGIAAAISALAVGGPAGFGASIALVALGVIAAGRSDQLELREQARIEEGLDRVTKLLE